MKKLVKISHKVKKRISLFLLINFVFYTILLAFPQKDCDKVCCAKTPVKNECSMKGNMSCCKMMEEYKHPNSFSSKTEITKSTCSHKYISNEYNNFILPKISDSKEDLIVFAEFELDSKINTVQKFFISHNTLSDVSPPIYLIVSSFLI